MAEGANQAVVGRDGSGAGGSAPTEPLTPIVDVAKDRCPNCGANLAVDQRYCLNCGARRGKPRYTLAPAEPVAPVAPPLHSGPRFSPGAALLTGLVTLLLALGVGVLIGHSGNNASGRQPINVSVGGGSSAPSGSSASTGGAGTSGSSGSHKAKSGGHAKSSSHAAKSKPLPAAARKVVAPKPLKKAAAVASKHVTSTTGQNSIGSKCSGGAGCHHGKQTGVFFGG